MIPSQNCQGSSLYPVSMVLRKVVFCISGSVANATILLQNLTLKEAFEPAVQLNKQLKREEFDCSWGKKFKFLIHRFLFMFSQNVEKW